jgi:hypothetical protein
MLVYWRLWATRSDGLACAWAALPSLRPLVPQNERPLRS